MNDPDVDVDFYDSYFAEMADESDFTWISTLEDFAEDPREDKLFFRLDGHLTAAGNEIVANAFFRKILRVLNEKRDHMDKLVRKQSVIGDI